MIDDLSRQLNSLANTIDRPIDLPALHRRISRQDRRRTMMRVSVATGGVAAVVGGIFVVREAAPPPAGIAVSAADPGTAPATSAATLPECSVLLASQRESAAAAGTNTKPAPDESAAAMPTVDFKSVVSIVAVDGSTITVTGGEPKSDPPATHTVILDATTEWHNGATTLAAPAPLHVGDTVGLAALTAKDGAEHAVFVDVGATVSPDQSSAPTDKPDGSIVLPGPTLAPGPTSKSLASITAVTETSITVALHGGAVDGKTATADLAGTTFYAGNEVCRPTGLTAGTEVGIAFHLDDASGVVADAILLIS